MRKLFALLLVVVMMLFGTVAVAGSINDDGVKESHSTSITITPTVEVYSSGTIAFTASAGGDDVVLGFSKDEGGETDEYTLYENVDATLEIENNSIASTLPSGGFDGDLQVYIAPMFSDDQPTYNGIALSLNADSGNDYQNRAVLSQGAADTITLTFYQYDVSTDVLGVGVNYDVTVTFNIITNLYPVE